jgi:hypothetical protein
VGGYVGGWIAGRHAGRHADRQTGTSTYVGSCRRATLPTRPLAKLRRVRTIPIEYGRRTRQMASGREGVVGEEDEGRRGREIVSFRS